MTFFNAKLIKLTAVLYETENNWNMLKNNNSFTLPQ